MAGKKHYKGYSIRKRKNSNSFEIRISFQGKTQSFYYHPPEGLTESKQYAAAEKEAIRRRDYVQAGYTSKIPTFSSYADYYISTKKTQNLRQSTLMQYKYLLPRLLEEFGDDRLDQITPQHLNKFYAKLINSNTFIAASAVAIQDKLLSYLSAHNITYKQIHEKAHVAINTASLAAHGNRVSANTAAKICDAYGLRTEDYFYIICNARPLSDKTVHEHINLLSNILKTAVRERIIDFNPVDASAVPSMGKSQINYYQPDEISRILTCLKEEDLRWQVLISLLIVTGCRRGEIVGLRWSAILWDYSLLRINHEVLYDAESGIYSVNATKNIDEKYVQVDRYTMDLLKQYKTEIDQQMDTLRLPKNSRPEYLFFQISDPDKPLHPSSVNQFLARFSKKHGFKKINPHSFRHSLASALIADGVDLYAVSKQLGHKQVATTREIYTHEINEHQAKIAARIPEIYHREIKEP